MIYVVLCLIFHWGVAQTHKHDELQACSFPVVGALSTPRIHLYDAGIVFRTSGTDVPIGEDLSKPGSGSAGGASCQPDQEVMRG